MVIDIQTFLEITLLLANLGKSIGGVRIILLLEEPSFLILDKFHFWLALVTRERKIVIF